VQPAPVVNLIDEARKPRDHLLEALVVAEVNLLALERLHEALGLAVVVRIAASSHRAHQPMRGQFAPIGLQRTVYRDRNDESGPLEDGARGSRRAAPPA
jgi:hypothetical protein